MARALVTTGTVDEHERNRSIPMNLGFDVVAIEARDRTPADACTEGGGSTTSPNARTPANRFAGVRAMRATNRTRTGDLSFTKASLYQLSYGGVSAVRRTIRPGRESYQTSPRSRNRREPVPERRPEESDRTKKEKIAPIHLRMNRGDLIRDRDLQPRGDRLSRRSGGPSRPARDRVNRTSDPPRPRCGRCRLRCWRR